MDRRKFLKIFGIGVGTAAAASVPLIAKAKEARKETWTVGEMFNTCDGNKDLLYLKKDSWLNYELAKILGDKYVDEKYFGCYMPYRDVLIPVKDEYDRRDFEPVILLMKERGRNSFDYYCGKSYKGVEQGLFRLLKDRDGEYYHIDFYAARNPKRNSIYG